MKQPKPARLFLYGGLISLFLAADFEVKGQPRDCSAWLKNDTLVVRNSRIEQKWLWNNGDLKDLSIKDCLSGKIIFFDHSITSFLPGNHHFQKNSSLKIQTRSKDLSYPEHLEVSVANQYLGLQLTRIFRIFPGVPAISSDYLLKYRSLIQERNEAGQKADGTEQGLKKAEERAGFSIATLRFNSPHWQIKAVAFRDVTDRQDNLVWEKEFIPYRMAEIIEGNLLFADDLAGETGFFLLKEAPNGKSQVNYPGYDFSVSNKELSIPFSGFPHQSDDETWIKGYTITTGIGKEEGLRSYLKNSVNYDPAVYEMVMMNTWGDRGQDGKISEQFILRELETAAKLGISHFQIDDGWQQGLSANSANKSGRLWDAWTPDNWQLNKERFPNGWTAILKKAKEKNISLGLWFHPSNENSYARWETDAGIIINLYRETGIRYFKIDGVEIPDKNAEINLRRFFEKVKQETNGQVFFNLDLTAGTRGGYFMFRNAGNLFLENRYTDWGNYYPFHTLRNLWTLANYFPPEFLQVEFLNKWRNPDKYPAQDPFAPSRYKLDYLFAITMAGQPLAWFEATGLPDHAFADPELIRKYRAVQQDFHAGQVFPVGDEPSGRSWTGFQSIGPEHGYLLIFRENTEKKEAWIKTFLPEGKTVILRPVLGQPGEKTRKVKVSSGGQIPFNLPEMNSFILYEYKLTDE